MRPVLCLVLGPVGVAVHARHGVEGGGHGEWGWRHSPSGAGEHGAVVEGGIRIGCDGDTLGLDGLSLPGLYVVFLQVDGSVNPMNLVVETTSIAHNGAAVLNSSPQCGL